MTSTIKTNHLHILTLNNQTYIPFQPHTLPSYFNSIPLTSIIKYKSYTYINIKSLKQSLKYYTNNLTFNKSLSSSLIHQK